MNSQTLRITTWDINGGVINKRLFLYRLMESCDVLCIQEYFLSSESLDILSLDGWLKVFGVSAISCQSGKGRPSGGIAVLARAEPLPTLHSSSDNLLRSK